MGDKRDDKKPLSQTLYKVGERNSTSPDDLPKWEVAKIARNSLQLEKKCEQGGWKEIQKRSGAMKKT